MISTRTFRVVSAMTIAAAINSTALIAQGNPTGNNSDVSGPPVTSGEVAGGAFAPAPAAAGTTPALATPAAQAAVATAAGNISSSLASGTMTSVGGAAISPAAQAMLLSVLSTSAPTTGAAAQLSTTLSAAGGTAAAVLPALLASISGLANNPAQLAPAIGNYNQFVAAASGEFLANPPQAFLALQTVLSQMSAAASGAR